MKEVAALKNMLDKVLIIQILLNLNMNIQYKEKKKDRLMHQTQVAK